MKTTDYVFKDESWKTKALCDYLENAGYRVYRSDISEPVIEFLCDEIGLLSYNYVAARYQIDPLIAKSMIRDMIKAKKELIDPYDNIL